MVFRSRMDRQFDRLHALIVSGVFDYPELALRIGLVAAAVWLTADHSHSGPIYRWVLRGFTELVAQPKYDPNSYGCWLAYGFFAYLILSRTMFEAFYFVFSTLKGRHNWPHAHCAIAGTTIVNLCLNSVSLRALCGLSATLLCVALTWWHIQYRYTRGSLSPYTWRKMMKAGPDKQQPFYLKPDPLLWRSATRAFSSSSLLFYLGPKNLLVFRPLLLPLLFGAGDNFLYWLILGLTLILPDIYFTAPKTLIEGRSMYLTNMLILTNVATACLAQLYLSSRSYLIVMLVLGGMSCILLWRNRPLHWRRPCSWACNTSGLAIAMLDGYTQFYPWSGLKYFWGTRDCLIWRADRGELLPMVVSDALYKGLHDYLDEVIGPGWGNSSEYIRDWYE